MGKLASLEGMTLEDMTESERPSVRLLAKFFINGGKGNIHDLVKEIGVTRSAISHAIRHMREVGVIRICEWLPPDGARTTPLAVHIAGSKPDAPKPEVGKVVPYQARLEQRERVAQAEKELEEKRALTKEVGDVIKPRLTPEQAYETNRRYWNWISSGAYG